MMATETFKVKNNFFLLLNGGKNHSDTFTKYISTFITWKDMLLNWGVATEPYLSCV